MTLDIEVYAEAYEAIQSALEELHREDEVDELEGEVEGS